jgi:predicted transcriptional regulator
MKMVCRSKLEQNVAILKVLAYEGPMRYTHIMYKTNINCAVLKEYLKSMAERNLIEKRDVTERHNPSNKHEVFAITQHGVTALKRFNDLNQALQLIEVRNSQPVPY